MSADIIPFDFEEQAIRVVMRGPDPWFVAADVCRALEIGNSRDAVTRLDDDEVTTTNLNTVTTNDGIQATTATTNTVGSTDGIRGNPNATIINESGLYALILTSRKEAARRFRKWVTAEVLPSLRNTGRYEIAEVLVDTPDDTGDARHIAGMPMREAEVWLQMVREARLTHGTRAAVSLWDRSPLPALRPGAAQAAVSPANGQACLAHLLTHLGDVIATARATTQDSAALAPEGLRAYPDSLFIANFPLPVFRATPWQGGLHRAALLTLDTVTPASGARTLAGVRTRGLELPWQLIEARVAA